MVKQYKNKRKRRHTRVRGKISGTAARPRLSVFRSNKYIYAQIIDDEKGKTLVAFSDVNEKLKMPAPSEAEGKNEKLKKTEIAKLIGQELGKKALKANIRTVVFDRGGYKYHGRVKALAEGAREVGLNF